MGCSEQNRAIIRSGILTFDAIMGGECRREKGNEDPSSGIHKRVGRKQSVEKKKGSSGEKEKKRKGVKGNSGDGGER
jgi:hypothetical protein